MLEGVEEVDGWEVFSVLDKSWGYGYSTTFLSFNGLLGFNGRLCYDLYLCEVYCWVCLGRVGKQVF